MNVCLTTRDIKSYSAEFNCTCRLSDFPVKYWSGVIDCIMNRIQYNSSQLLSRNDHYPLPTTLWAHFQSLGIARTTKRGCRAGKRKLRKIQPVRTRRPVIRYQEQNGRSRVLVNTPKNCGNDKPSSFLPRFFLTNACSAINKADEISEALGQNEIMLQ